jgi:DNA-binding FadR family transcriptional regulator
MMPAIKFHTRILKAIANAGDLTMASEVSRQLTEFTEVIENL